MDLDVLPEVETWANPSDKRCRAPLDLHGELENTDDFLGGGGDEEVPSVMFFSVLRKGYSRSRVIPIPAAAAFKMSPDDMGIVLHQRVFSDVAGS
eukprot:390224-Pyramimonas_sp.AAC.1